MRRWQRRRLPRATLLNKSNCVTLLIRKIMLPLQALFSQCYKLPHRCGIIIVPHARIDGWWHRQQQQQQIGSVRGIPLHRRQPEWVSGESTAGWRGTWDRISLIFQRRVITGALLIRNPLWSEEVKAPRVVHFKELAFSLCWAHKRTPGACFAAILFGC